MESKAHLAPTEGPLLQEELQLAFRNRGMPLEAMRYDLTPTGLHYLVIHWDIPAADAGAWQLRVGGLVQNELAISMQELKAMPATTMPVTMECAGNGRALLSPRPLSIPWLGEAIGTADWTGVPLKNVLERAGIDPEAVELVFYGADRGIQGEVEHTYGRSLEVSEAMREEVLLAYGMNGRELEPQHGFPLRLIVPGWYGMTSVKWLTAIEAVAEPFQGFQQADTYRYAQSDDDPGEPVTRMRVRSMMSPPGVPDFFSRQRYLEPGPVELSGRAWSGYGPVTKVEVGVDDHWSQAELAAPVGDYAWRSWSWQWEATPGEHVLSCRASDSTGDAQPIEPNWNYQGMGVNPIQRIVVSVA